MRPSAVSATTTVPADPKPGTNPEADAPASVTLPDGVRLQLELPPGQALAGRLTRDWVNPLKGGGKS